MQKILCQKLVVVLLLLVWFRFFCFLFVLFDKTNYFNKINERCTSLGQVVISNLLYLCVYGKSTNSKQLYCCMCVCVYGLYICLFINTEMVIIYSRNNLNSSFCLAAFIGQTEVWPELEQVLKADSLGVYLVLYIRAWTSYSLIPKGQQGQRVEWTLWCSGRRFTVVWCHGGHKTDDAKLTQGNRESQKGKILASAVRKDWRTVCVLSSWNQLEASNYHHHLRTKISCCTLNLCPVVEVTCLT